MLYLCRLLKQPPRITAICRAAAFSPNAAERDRAILEAVCRELAEEGLPVSRCVEGDEPLPPADVYVTMGRSPRLLDRLQAAEREGCLVVNSPEAVRLCGRRALLRSRLLAAAVPLAEPQLSEGGFWVKRGDAPTQQPADVVFCTDETQCQEAVEALRRRGISEWVVSPHVAGDLVKFYGVLGAGFFHTCYPADGSYSKFGQEALNGRSHHYDFSVRALQEAAEEAARAAGLQVYGGDAIIRSDGRFCLIDLNDWPSFAPCRDAAARAIATTVCRLADSHIKEREQK
jgi:hypothetical protein